MGFGRQKPVSEVVQKKERNCHISKLKWISENVAEKDKTTRDHHLSCSWALRRCLCLPGSKYGMYNCRSPAAPLRQQQSTHFSARFRILHTCIELSPVRTAETRSRKIDLRCSPLC